MNALSPAPRLEIQSPARMGQDLALIGLFERLATDPTIPLDRIDRLMTMQREMMADRARAAFTVDMARLQPMLPTVEQNGRLVITDKNDRNKVIQSTPYAKWEDINEAIRGPLGECGFALTFRAERKGDQVIITGILSHREGHQESTDISLALDSTGSKNNVQAVGSSISYGKRYTAGMLLNITSRAKFEADDDGTAAGAGEGLGDAEVARLREALEFVDGDEAKFCKVLGVSDLAAIRPDKFQAALDKINAKGKRS